MSKTALVIGSSGLIGGHLLQLLNDDSSYAKIIAFVREVPTHKLPKVLYMQHSFLNTAELEPALKGDSLFICIGSTIAKAGSQKAFSYVDYEIPVGIASIAAKNNVADCFVVSSLGADSTSSNFYLQTKGKMEDAISKLSFTRICFVRPSLLLGARQEKRKGEMAGKVFMKLFAWLFIGPLKKYKGIEALQVAKSMLIISASSFTGKKIIENNELLQLGQH